MRTKATPHLCTHTSEQRSFCGGCRPQTPPLRAALRRPTVVPAVGRSEIERQPAVRLVKHHAEGENVPHPAANLGQVHNVLVKPIAVQPFGAVKIGDEFGRVSVKRLINPNHQLARDAVFAVVPAARIGEHLKPTSHRAPQLLAHLRAQLPVDLRIRTLQDRCRSLQQTIARAQVRIDGWSGRVVGNRFGAGHHPSCSGTARRPHRITAPQRL